MGTARHPDLEVTPLIVQGLKQLVILVTLPIIALMLPVGFLPLYLVGVLLWSSGLRIVHDDFAEPEEVKRVRLALEQLEDFANGESK